MKRSLLALLSLALVVSGVARAQDAPTPTEPATPQAPATAPTQTTPSAAPTKVAKKVDTPLQSWRTRLGKGFLGSLEGYDLETRELILEDNENKVVRVPAHDLDGRSKVQWLRSPNTWRDLQANYPWQERLPGLLITLAGLLALWAVLGFVFYWLAVSMVAGDGNFIKALKSYILANLGIFVVYVVWVGVTFLLATFMKESKAMPFLAGGFGILVVLGSIGVFCQVVGKTYTITGCAGCGVLVIWGIFILVLEIALYFGWPLLLEEPVVEQMISDYVLTPLQLI